MVRCQAERCTPALQELLQETAKLGDSDTGALCPLQPPVQPVLQLLRYHLECITLPSTETLFGVI